MAVVQPPMNTRTMMLSLLLLAMSACSSDADLISVEGDAAASSAIESVLAVPPTGVWLIEAIVDDNGEIVDPWEGEDGYSTRVIITREDDKIMAYDFCGTVPTQVVLSPDEGFYRADLALDEATSMAACKQMVSSDNARFTPINETTILVSTRGLDITLHATDEPCPAFLADGC